MHIHHCRCFQDHLWNALADSESTVLSSRGVWEYPEVLGNNGGQPLYLGAFHVASGRIYILLIYFESQVHIIEAMRYFG